jgi:hypothetical protein
MLNEQDIGSALRRANPAPDPEHTVSDTEASDLFAAISQRRRAMVHTKEKPTTREDRAVGERSPWTRKRLALVAAAFFVLIAVPAVALLVDFDTPPLDQEFPEGSAPIVVYGVAEGVDEYCAWRMDFDSNDVPVMAGACGVLRLDGEQWGVASAEVGSGSLMDIAIAPDGTVWLADIDGPILSIDAGTVTSHAVRARAVEVTTDGTVWAIRYGPNLSPVLMSYDGTAFVEHNIGPVDELMAGDDGSLRTLAVVPVDYDPETQAASEWHLMLGEMVDGVYTSELAPEGFGDHATLAPDGALWAIGQTGRHIEREGVTDTEWTLVRWDGSEMKTIIIPFPEPHNIAVHPDGSVWVASSLYGAFAYDGDDWVQYGMEEGLPDLESAFVAAAPDGSVYIGTRLGVTRITPGTG